MTEELGDTIPRRVQRQPDVYEVTIDGGEGGRTFIRAASDDAAIEWALNWAEDADTNSAKSTVWFRTSVRRNGRLVWQDDVAVDPPEPPCANAGGHDWISPVEVVGGLVENPGVWGKGGGVLITQVCAYCGVYKITDTWAQNPETGEQGLESVTYRDPDNRSLAYIGQREED